MASLAIHILAIGMGRDATLCILERGIRMNGIDNWFWDSPLHTEKKFMQTGDAELISLNCSPYLPVLSSKLQASGCSF